MNKIAAFFLALCFQMPADAEDWAETTLSKMSVEEKIGQLFIIPACPLRGDEHLADLAGLIIQKQIGGLILKQGTPEGQVALINRLQSLSDLPLLCLQDAEWGLNMRLEGTVRFPKNLTLGAIQDNHLLYDLGKEIGRQCKQVGAHINLAPVVDVNTDPKNPIIHRRSFGDDPKEVAARGLLVMQGMQESGILACAKHFPGHGAVSVDSHVDLPMAQELQLYPFQQMIQGGVSAILTAHLLGPGFDGPATFSKQLISGELKDFKGLVITDALNMQALARYFSVQEIALNAFLAGHDLLLYGDHIAPNIDQILRQDLPQAISALTAAFHQGIFSESELDEHVLKILKVKERLNLHQERMVPPPTELHTKEALALKRELYRRAITLIRNEQGLVPLPKDTPIMLLQTREHPYFTETLSRHVVICDQAEIVVLATDEQIPEPLVNKKMIRVHFGSPYTLDPSDAAAILLAYEDDQEAQIAAANALSGTLEPIGILPVKLPGWK